MDRRSIEKELDSFAQRMQNQGITVRFDAKLAYGDIPGRLMELMRMILEFKKTQKSGYPDLDIESVRSLVEAIESKLMILRTMALEERERFERMELELEQELKMIEENVTKIPSSNNGLGQAVALNNETLPSEVIEFQVLGFH
jgi:hypothetical protein